MSDKHHFNATTYETVKIHLKNSLEHVIAAGHNVRDFSEFIVDKFGETYIPHLRQFLSDVGNGEIKIKGLSKAAISVIVGHHVSLEERETMIREAAYYRSKSRNFAPGYEADDWAAAVKEVDARLVEEAGLIDKGRKVLESTATSVEKEFENIRAVVTTWLEDNSVPAKKNMATKKSVAKKATKKTPAPSQDVNRKETVAKAVTQEGEKVTKKSAKKKAASKKPATKEPIKKKTVKKKKVVTKKATRKH
jgi:hypothetical protein